jgi:DNA-3-methyladenine glycosylase II
MLGAMHADAERTLSGADARLGRLIAHVGPCRLKPRTKVSRDECFESLVHAIVGQQLSPKAASAISDRLVSKVEALEPARLVKATEEELRSVGLSGAKARSVRDLADKTLSGAIDLGALDSLDDDAVTTELCRVKGIGVWTAHMFLMFRLGRTDVLPVGDLGVRKGFARLYRMKELPEADKMERLARPWRPHRSIASWYMWRITELDDETAAAISKKGR